MERMEHHYGHFLTVRSVCLFAFINIFVGEDVQGGYIAGFYHNINVFFYPFGDSTPRPSLKPGASPLQPTHT